MRIEIIVFDGVDALDAVGPWEVFARAHGIDSRIEVALVTMGEPGVVRAAEGLELVVHERFGNADAVVVPGGSWVSGADNGVRREIREGELPRRLAAAASDLRWISSVCTGALLLGAAGLLRGRNATANRAALDEAARYGANVLDHRVVDDGNLVTSGGVTSGIDMALWLVRRECGAECARNVAHGLVYPEPTDVWTTSLRKPASNSGRSDQY